MGYMNLIGTKEQEHNRILQNKKHVLQFAIEMDDIL